MPCSRKGYLGYRRDDMGKPNKEHRKIKKKGYGRAKGYGKSKEE
jgi:hypothetical protein